ncbi:MAG: hypothetical protein SVS85_03565 [Candidatus Nanohaloarchaea archaeon]|nr:hypothetical protein [Candidatus Nanohaloarchaea archaeon]
MTEHYAYDEQYLIKRTVKLSGTRYLRIGGGYVPDGENVVAISMEVEGIPLTLPITTSRSRVTLYKRIAEAFEWEDGDEIKIKLLGYHTKEHGGDE